MVEESPEKEILCAVVRFPNARVYKEKGNVGLAKQEVG